MQLPSPSILSISLFILAGIFIAYYPSISQQNSYMKEFQEWKTKYHKNYKGNEELLRFVNFIKTKIEVQEHNKRAVLGLESWYMGINKFADLTDEEFFNAYLSKPTERQIERFTSQQTSYNCTGKQPSQKTVPDAFDWAGKSAMTSVKDHGTCAAGYAFAAVESIESSRFITSGKLIELSPQQIIDCTKDYDNKGCISGNASGTFAYLYKTGVASQKKYPFRGFTYNCAYNITQKQTQILGCIKLASNKEASIKNAVYHQPYVAAINAAKIKNYEKGVYESTPHLINPCKNDPNHWMLLVGYGRDESQKKNYWKLKNSWGAHWGQQGYFYIVRNGDGEGECGVQAQLYAPIA